MWARGESKTIGSKKNAQGKNSKYNVLKIAGNVITLLL